MIPEKLPGLEMAPKKPLRKNIFVFVSFVVLLAAGLIYAKTNYLSQHPKAPTTVSCDDGKGKEVKCASLFVTMRSGLSAAEKDALEASIVTLGARVIQMDHVDTWPVSLTASSSSDLQKSRDQLGALPNVTNVEFDYNDVHAVAP